MCLEVVNSLDMYQMVHRCRDASPPGYFASWSRLPGSGWRLVSGHESAGLEEVTGRAGVEPGAADRVGAGARCECEQADDRSVAQDRGPGVPVARRPIAEGVVGVAPEEEQ